MTNLHRNLVGTFILLFYVTYLASAQAPVYDVKKYGAKGDGKNLDNKAFDKAIEEANAAGGETVYFPAGDCVSVTIHLKSNFDHFRGLALLTVEGAALEDITISNITMRDIGNSPIFIRLGARMRAPKDFLFSQLHRILISNIVAYDVTGDQCAIISGIPRHDIEDLTLSNIHIYYKGGGTKVQAAREVRALIKDYPEPDMFGITPAYGFFIRNVKDVKMSDVEVSYMQEDLRPAFILDNVDGADFQHIRAQKAAGVPTFSLNQIKNFNLFNSGPLPATKLTSADEKEL